MNREISEIDIIFKEGVKVSFNKEIGVTIHSDINPFTEKESEYLSYLYKVLFPQT